MSRQAEGGVEAVAEEGAVEGDVGRPGKEANANLAVRVVQPAGDEVAGVRDEIDLGTVGGIALHGGDGPGVDPRVAPVEGAGAARLEDDAARAHELPFSTASM